LAVFSDIRKVILYPPAIFGIITGFLFITGNELVNVVFGVWMQDSFAIKIAALGTASIVIGLSELAGEGISAILAERLGKERTVGVSLFLNAIW
jgi:predicted MFS family arabinose efflux permease